jgi:hypothetical protein
MGTGKREGQIGHPADMSITRFRLAGARKRDNGTRIRLRQSKTGARVSIRLACRSRPRRLPQVASARGSADRQRGTWDFNMTYRSISHRALVDGIVGPKRGKP